MKKVQTLQGFRSKKLKLDASITFFINHKQSSASDMAGRIYDRLTARGMSVWYDQELDGNLGEPEMKEGIEKSKCYLLLLSTDVFKSDAVLMELKVAYELKKPFLVVHQSQGNLLGFAPFGTYIKTVPSCAKGLFTEKESLAFQRRRFLAVPFYTELVKRINDS